MTQAQERLLDLLAEQATEGLDEARRTELAELRGEAPELPDDYLEAPAAALELAFFETEAELPAELESRIRGQAQAFRAGTGAQAAPATATNGRVVPFPQAPPSEPPRRAGWVGGAGWAVAASLLLAFAAFWWARGAVAPAPLPDPAAVVAAAPDVLTLPWTATEDPAAAGVTGEVQWSSSRQAGVMRFRGLPVNDPGQYQYQLWIFDVSQDERYPIDGGVFDITDGEALVPIDAKLGVDRPTLFAITIEPPGGVVVSSRERLVLIAPVA